MCEFYYKITKNKKGFLMESPTLNKETFIIEFFFEYR